MPGLVPNEFETQAALELIPGVEVFSNLGFNSVIPTTTFILLSNITSAALVSNFPPVPQQIQIVSTSANDTAAGTGAQQVTIDYLTSPSSVFGFRRFSEIVTLNGLVPVNTVATDISRIEKVRVSRTGTGAVAAGNISIQSVGGASTFERIDQGENVSRTAVHFVPNGFMSVLTNINVGTTTVGGVRFSITTVLVDPIGNAVRIGLEEIGFANAGTSFVQNTPIVLINDSNRRLSFAIAVRGLTANQSGSASIVAIDIPL